MNGRLFSFVGGGSGPWRVVDMRAIAGDGLAEVRRLGIVVGGVVDLSEGARWILRGLTSNERYVTRQEKDRLVAKQPALGRPEASCAALIPIRKNASWWALTQDERRKIFEEQSKHIKLGLDFLTWFQFAPSDSAAFDGLVAELRASEEWAYVDREVDIRVVRE
jgi:hypothetical protein